MVLPRAAYSHSASVRSRYSLPVNCESQPTYCLASPQLTLITGISPRPPRSGSRGDASIPLFECHLELGNGEWLCDRHLMRRAFTGFPVRLILRRAHNEFASRDDDHSRAAVRAFLEIRARLCRLCLLLLNR